MALLIRSENSVRLGELLFFGEGDTLVTAALENAESEASAVWQMPRPNHF
jgi:hypothetical protein